MEKIDNFAKVFEAAKNNKAFKLAVAEAQDEAVIEAILQAQREGLASPILLGNPKQISQIIKDLGGKPENFDIIESASPEESAAGQLLKEQVASVLSALTDREQKIVKMRFGLDDGKNHTLEEVGQEFSVTRERIRQIEAKALAKLRKHKDAKKLYEYLQ